MVDFTAQGGCRLLFEEKHFNAVLRESLDVGIFSLVGCSDIIQEQCKNREVQLMIQQRKQRELHEEPFYANFLNFFEKLVN